MRAVECLAAGILRTMAVVAVGIFAWIIGYIVFEAWGAFSMDWMTPGGVLWSPMVGTVLLVITAVALALPVGVATGIYLRVYATVRVRNIFGFLFELLASIPSILMGLFGFALVLMLHQWCAGFLPSWGLAAGSVAMLILPYLIKAVELGIIEAPSDHVALAYTMGATREQVLWHIQFPAARTHLFKGILLAVGRAAEDTAVILLTGVVASYGIPGSLWEPFEALPFYIYTTTAEYGSQGELGTVFVAAALLVGLGGIFVFLAGTVDARISGEAL